MILPAGVQQSIDKNNIDISTGWMFASFPIWNLDYTAPLAQPVSMAAVPLADLRFLDPTVTLVIRQSASPGSLVLWSGVAVMDDDAGGGGEPEHNDLPGRDVADAHPLASITGLVDALDGKAAALHASTHYAGGSDPIAGQSLAGLQTTDSPAFNRLVLTENGDGVSGANICALVLDSNEPVFAFKNDAGSSQNKYWNIGVNAGDWGPSFYHINDAKTLKTPVWRTKFNTTTGKIEFTLGFSGLADTIVSGTFKIGSLAGTLIGTAGNVSALSGTNLVLGNGTTIPQSTFATGGPFLPLAGGTMADDALVTFNSTAANLEPSAIAINRPFIGGSQTQDAGIDISTGNGHGLRIALQSGNFYSGLQVNNASSEFAVELLLSGAGTKSLYAAGSVLIDGAVDAGAGVNVSGGAIQIAGDDAITAARAGDLTALKVGSLAGGGNVVADVDGFLVIEDPEDPFIFRNTEPGSFTVTGSGVDSILTQSSAGNRGSLTHDISEILAAGNVIEFEFHGTGVSNTSSAAHNSSWRLTCSALSLTADSLTVETLALPANTPFRWSCRAKVFGRSIDGAPSTTRRVVALLEYSRTASDVVTYYPSATIEFGTVDTTSPLSVTWAAGLIEASSALPHDMVTQFSQIAVVPVAGGVGGGSPLPLEIGSDGDMVYTHSTGQKLFNGNFLYSWTYQGGGDYSNLTVDSTTETTIVDETDAGRNGLFPILSPGYLLGQGPIWVRVRGGYGVIGANPVLTVRVYMGTTVVGTKRIDLSTFTRTTENMGFGLLFWIEPINAVSPGTSLRLRTHHYGQASQGLADAAGSFLLSEDETYSNIDGTAAQNLKVTAQWSALGSQTWAFFDGIEVYR